MRDAQAERAVLFLLGLTFALKGQDAPPQVPAPAPAATTDSEANLTPPKDTPTKPGAAAEPAKPTDGTDLSTTESGPPQGKGKDKPGDELSQAIQKEERFWAWLKTDHDPLEVAIAAVSSLLTLVTLYVVFRQLRAMETQMAKMEIQTAIMDKQQNAMDKQTVAQQHSLILQATVPKLNQVRLRLETLLRGDSMSLRDQAFATYSDREEKIELTQEDQKQVEFVTSQICGETAFADHKKMVKDLVTQWLALEKDMDTAFDDVRAGLEQCKKALPNPKA